MQLSQPSHVILGVSHCRIPGLWTGLNHHVYGMSNCRVDSLWTGLTHHIHGMSNCRVHSLWPALTHHTQTCQTAEFPACGLGWSSCMWHVKLQSSQPLDWVKRLNMALDAAKGMLYLHMCQPPILHRDLKSANLLVSKHWKVKVHCLVTWTLLCVHQNDFLPQVCWSACQHALDSQGTLPRNLNTACCLQNWFSDSSLLMFLSVCNERARYGHTFNMMPAIEQQNWLLTSNLPICLLTSNGRPRYSHTLTCCPAVDPQNGRPTLNLLICLLGVTGRSRYDHPLTWCLCVVLDNPVLLLKVLLWGGPWHCYVVSDWRHGAWRASCFQKTCLSLLQLGQLLQLLCTHWSLCTLFEP